MVSAIIEAGRNALPMVMLSGEGTSMTRLTTSLVSGLEDIANQMLDSLGKILPVVLMVVGGVMVVTFGIKLFRKFGK